MYETDRKYSRYILVPVLLLFTVISCGRFSSDHPQAETENRKQLLSEHEILDYTDSVNAVLGQLDKQQSLIYSLGDYSFFAVRYNSNGSPLLYIKSGESDEYKNIEERYYLDDGNLVLYTKKYRQYLNDSTLLQRDYFRNGIMFYSEVRQAAAGEDAASIPFHKNHGEKTVPDLTLLEQALDQAGRFNLVFEGIAEYPQARYLILSRDELNAYRAAVLLENGDEFSQELVSNPEKYKGRKLDLNWRIRNGEAVYISGKLEQNR